MLDKLCINCNLNKAWFSDFRHYIAYNDSMSIYLDYSDKIIGWITTYSDNEINKLKAILKEFELYIDMERKR